MNMSVKTKSRLENNIGLSLAQVRKMSTKEQIAYVEKKTGVKLSFSLTKNPARRSRGNAALGEGRYRTMEEINAVLDAAIAKSQKNRNS